MWLEDQDWLAHSDVYPDVDSEDYDTDDPDCWLAMKEQDADDEYESQRNQEINVADTCKINTFSFFILRLGYLMAVCQCI